MHRAILVWAVGVSSGLASAALADEAASAAPTAYRRTLFDGRTLDGWVLENAAEADVVDGSLRLKAGDGWLRTHSQYRDFELHVEWQALQAENYDAGIYIRAAGTGAPFTKPAYQINLLSGKEGNIGNLPGAASTGLVKPAGQWNTFDIKVVGDTVSLKINDQPAYTASGLKEPQGYVGFQIEVPKGGQFLLRNIWITELGFQSLFNGVDLAGWTGAGAPAEACWRTENGLLMCTGAKGPWLRTADQYGDFNLRFDYQVSPGGNSGVYVRVPLDGNHHRADESQPAAGFEVQVLDDADPKYATLKDYQYSASVYDICGANPRVSRPAGEWNTLEINCRGQHVTTVHNGRIVVNATLAAYPLLGLRSTTGYLGLQNHSTEVRFRHLRVGPALEFPAEK